MKPFQFKGYQVALIVAGIVILSVLAGCTNTLKILEGSTHACGDIRVDGRVADGNVLVVKVPEGYTPEQVQEFCQPQ